MIEIQDLTVAYAGRPVIQGLSLNLAAGERVGISGESGCGKSTLLKAIAGVLPHSAQRSGCVRIHGKIGYIPQDAVPHLSPYLTVWRQVRDLASDDASVRDLMCAMKLHDPWFERAFPHLLSGGERQRILIAQALAQSPQILLADEPTANLDRDTETLVLEAIAAYSARSGAALLIASHRDRVFDVLGCRVQRLGPELPSVEPFLPASNTRETRPVVEVEGLTKTYQSRRILWRPTNVVRAITRASLSIREGEIVALTGPSGSGKSTLARCLAKREPFDSGSVSLRGAPLWSVRSIARHVQLVQQDPSESLNPRLTVRSVLREAPAANPEEWLEKLNLPLEWLGRRVSDLSEGQRARVAIARALAALQGGLLILDESFSGLDRAAIVSLLNVLARVLESSGMACLWITHDPDLAAGTAARILRIDRGELPA